MAFNFFTPDAIKAIALHFGSYDKAAKHLHIGKASLVDAGNADIKGKSYQLSLANQQKIFTYQNRIGAAKKKDIKEWYKLLESISDHPNIKRAFMNAKPTERVWAKTLHAQKKYARLKSKVFWEKVMSKFYDKYHWQRGQWKR